MSNLDPLIWKEDHLLALDQRLLPMQVHWFKIDSTKSCFEAIELMIVRGAPCIGFTGIYGVAFAIKEASQSFTSAIDIERFELLCEYLISARPTAVNLSYEINLIANKVKEMDGRAAYDFCIKQAEEKIKESEQKHQQMASFALEEMRSIYHNEKLNVFTHCNTGRLACGSKGTALGCIETLAQNNLINNVWVDETRPYLQGSRLTAFELAQAKINHKIINDSAAAFVMASHKCHAVFVGADRIALNGDTANKIGTFQLALTAKYFNVPFYVVAPLSSFDTSTLSGDNIEIEMRPKDEIKSIKGTFFASRDSDAFNPSFDVTPASLITGGIICEKGIIKSNFNNRIKEFCES